MAQGHLDTAKDDPQDIEAHGEAAHATCLVSYRTAKGVEWQARHLEELQADWDAYDGDAVDDSQYEVGDR